MIGQLAPARTASAKFTATGGTITVDGLYTVHTFNSSGTFTPSKSGTVDYLIVAGGGAGGHDYGGGGGAGGVLTSTDLAVTAQAYTVTIGDGAVTCESGAGATGSDSSFAGLTAKGGGGGAGGDGSAPGTGGSGGGGSFTSATGGAGTSGQGYAGGDGTNDPEHLRSGGGGGASEVGTAGVDDTSSGDGGDGVASSITGASVVYGGGGGGGGYSGYSIAGGAGGTGGGGAGATSDAAAGTAGTANTGGGGGGGAGNHGNGGAGGKGVVIIRYLTAVDGNTGTVTNRPHLNISFDSNVPVYAEVFSLFTGRVWNGTTFVPYAMLVNTDAWRACLIPMIEQKLADDTLTGHYMADAPAALQREAWAARIFNGALTDLTPTTEPIGTQTGQTLSELLKAYPGSDPR